MPLRKIGPFTEERSGDELSDSIEASLPWRTSSTEDRNHDQSPEGLPESGDGAGNMERSQTERCER